MPLAFIIFSLTAVVLLSILLFLRMKGRAAYEIGGTLEMTLLRILVPKDEVLPVGQSQETHQKNALAAMEQFFSSLSILRTSWMHDLQYGAPAAVFEIALPHVGEEVTFYVAVRRKYIQFIQDEIHSLFPSARVEETLDYNIFHPTGVSIGSYAELKTHGIVPLQTYQNLGRDSLEVIVGAFAKMKKVGDGAAIQVVVRPAQRALNQKGKDVARKIREGKSLKEALGGAGLEAKKILSPDSKPKENTSGVHDEDLAKQVEGKSLLPGFDVNLRILVSAATGEEASRLLEILESSFRQFANPTGNDIRFNHVRGRAFEKLAYLFSFRLFRQRSSLYLSTSELASIVHVPYSGFSQSKISYLKSRNAPPPTSLSGSGLLVGESVHRGESRRIYLADEDRRRHMYIIGQTGTGKSALLEELARQDILAGKGVCFIDPHGEAIGYLLEHIPPERFDDVIYFNPGDIEQPMGMNFLQYDPRFPEQKTFIVNELLEIFNKLYNMQIAGGPMFEQYFRNATLLVMDDPQSGNTLLEISRVLADKEFRDLKLSRSSNIVVHAFWKKIAEQAKGESSLQNMVPYITSKFDTFLSNEIMRPIITQETSAFNFRDVMDQQKILLINLSKGRLGELNSALLGLVVVGKILMAALSRADIAEHERRDFYLYIDEFQNVTTKSIATILSEARKYRLNLTIAHQFLGQLEDEIKKAVFGNVGTLISFRVGTEDSEFLEKQFAPVFQARDLINIENYHAHARLLIHGEPARPFNIRTFPPSRGDAAGKAHIIEHARTKYGRPRIEVEESMRRRFAHV